MAAYYVKKMGKDKNGNRYEKKGKKVNKITLKKYFKRIELNEEL